MNFSIRSIFVFAATLAVLSSCSTGQPAVSGSKKAEIYNQAGIEALNLNQPTEALTYLQEAVKFDSKSAFTWSNLGLAFFGKGEEKKAEDCWKRALSLDSTLTDARANLGALYLKQKKWAEAEKNFKLALKDLTYSKVEQVHFNLGLLYLNQNRPLWAETQFRQAVKANPDYCGAWFRLGQLQKDKGDFSMAAQSFGQSVRGTCFRNPEAHFEISNALIKGKNSEKAKLKLLEIIQFFPESDWAKKAELTLSMMSN